MTVLDIDIHLIKRENDVWADPESFIRVWQAASCMEDIVDTFRAGGVAKWSLDEANLRSRAYRYRSDHGIPLKRFPPPSRRTDWNELRDLARSLKENNT